MTGADVPQGEAVVRGEQEMRRLADAMPQLVWIATRDGKVVYYNARHTAYAGIRPAADGSYAWEPVIHPDDLDASMEAFRACVATGRPYEHEHRLRMADGSDRWHLSRALPMRDPVTGEERWYGTATDVHDLREAQEALRHSELTRALAMWAARMGWWAREAGPVGRDLARTAVIWSPELEELFGLPPGGFGGNEAAFFERVHADDRAPALAEIDAANSEGRDYRIEFRFLHATGEWRWMEGRGRALPDGGVVGTGMDITDRKRTEEALRAEEARAHRLERAAEDALRRSEQRLRLATSIAGIGTWERPIAGGALELSEAARRIACLDAAERVEDLEAFIHPDDRPRLAAARETARIPTAAGPAWTAEVRLGTPAGEGRWIRLDGMTLFAPDGDELLPAREVGVVSDVTERRRADDVREAFIGMLSHELRTPVTAIYGGSRMLVRAALPDEARAELLDDLVVESERLARLVDNLLVLARVERSVDLGGDEPVLVRPLVARVVEGERRARPLAEIRVDLDAGLPPVVGDEISVELALRNLVSNALKYGPSGGRVTVTGRQVAEGVELRVSDEGPGIAAEDRGRVFELFYRGRRDRATAPGAGIGLFVVRALVEAMGGSVAADEAPGGGAQLTMRLRAYALHPGDAGIGA